MAEIRIRVGASVDQNMRAAFRPLVQSAMDAKRQILREFAQVPREIAAAFAGLGRAQGGAFRGATAEARNAYREQAQLARQSAKEQEQAARSARRIEEQLERERVAGVRRAEREIRQEHARTEREQRRAAREAMAAMNAAMAGPRRFAQMASYSLARSIVPQFPIASLARRAGSEVARGLGVDPTLSGAMQRNIDLETLAQRASNSAMLAGQNISPATIEARVREVSDKYGVSRTQAASGALSFQKLTGDLDLGLAKMEDMVALSAATGTNVDDFAQAMGNASNALGDIPNKGKVLMEIMEAVAVHGAKGAVEVSDMAVHMARVSSTAGAFSGDPAENIKLMSVFGQLARAGGGAPSAAESARSVVGFANTFQKSARIRAFEDITGKSAYTDDTKREIRPALDLIKDALRATGGNREEMNKIFMDAIGARAMRGLLTIFNKAGGGEAGLADVDKKIGFFREGESIPEEIKARALAQFEGTTAAKVQKFQNKLDDVADRLQERLLPALDAAAPSIIKFVGVMGDMLAWAVSNPGKAFTAAILLSIARAGIDAAIRKGVESIVLSAATRMMGLPGGVGPGGIGAGGTMAGFARFAGPIGLGVAAGAALQSAIPAFSSEDVASRIGGWEQSSATLAAAAKDPTKVDAKERTKLQRSVQNKLDQLATMDHLAAVGASPTGALSELFQGNFGFAADAFTTNFDRLLGSAPSVFGKSKFDIKRDALVDSLARDQANLAALRANPYSKDSETVDKYIAKDPSKTSLSDMQAAFKRGGVEELEKIATLQTKQQSIGERMLTEAQGTNQRLDSLIDNLAPGGGVGTGVRTTFEEG